MCIACRQEKDKKDMLRIVRRQDGTVSLDFTGKQAGRGAYICDDPACIEKCVKNKLIGKVFDAQVGDDVYNYIAEEYAGHKR